MADARDRAGDLRRGRQPKRIAGAVYRWVRDAGPPPAEAEISNLMHKYPVQVGPISPRLLRRVALLDRLAAALYAETNAANIAVWRGENEHEARLIDWARRCANG